MWCQWQRWCVRCYWWCCCCCCGSGGGLCNLHKTSHVKLIVINNSCTLLTLTTKVEGIQAALTILKLLGGKFSHARATARQTPVVDILASQLFWVEQTSLLCVLPGPERPQRAMPVATETVTLQLQQKQRPLLWGFLSFISFVCLLFSRVLSTR